MRPQQDPPSSERTGPAVINTDTILDVHAQLTDEPKHEWKLLEVHDDIGYNVTVQHKSTSQRRRVAIISNGDVTVDVIQTLTTRN